MAYMWEDKEVRFDLPFSEMHLTTGEKVIDRLDNIEDTKGNGGDRGRLIITNLRLLWHSLANPRISLSVGHNCISNISTRIVNSKLKGTTQALHLLTLSNDNRFEFIFTNLLPGNMRHFTSILGVHQAYTSSRPYRELKLRAAVVHNKQLKILPLEQVFSTIHGIWNLSSDQGSPGTFLITNVRLVWFADTNESFNISLPYLQIENIKIRESKFGKALVITCTEISGGYILGFRIDPEEKLAVISKELMSVFTVYAASPIYGVVYELGPGKEAERIQNFIEDSDDVEEPRGEMSNVLTAYLADEGHLKDRPLAFSSELGLAIESLKEGFTLNQLWEVLPS